MTLRKLDSKAEQLKARAEKVDERTVALFKKYPLVGSAVFLAGLLIGLIVGTWGF